MSTQALSLDTTPRSRRRSFSIGATFVLLALIATCVPFVPNMGFVAVSAVFLGSFLGYLGLRSDGTGDLFEIIGLVTVLAFLYFCVGTFYLIAVPEALPHPSLAPFLLPALMLATLGQLCLLLGYAWSFRRVAPSPMGRFVPVSAMFCLVPAVIGAVGMNMSTFQLQLFRNYKGISASLSFLQQFSTLFFFGWFLGWYLLWAKKLRPSVAVFLIGSLTVLAAEVLYSTLGSKSGAVLMMIMPVLAYYQVRRRLPWKTCLGIALVFLFVVFPAYNTFRRLDHQLDTTRRLDRTVELAQGWGSSEFLDQSIFAFLNRMTLGSSVAAIISETGRWVEYKYGETLLLAPVGLLIPRFLWPDKPNLSLGREFGATFRFTGTFDRETYIAPSMVGELYWNFAVPGVAFGMWLLGLAYRWYYQRYGAGSGFDPIRKAIYATLLPTALSIEGNVAMAVGGFVKSLVIIAVFVAVSRRLGWLQPRTEA